MHDCPECGQACYCDQEDVMHDEPPADCRHDCDPADLDEDDDEEDD